MHTGMAKTDGIYSSLWKNASPHLHPPCSAHFWTSSAHTWKEKVQLFKARWGHLWSRKLAYRYRKAYARETQPPTSGHCPHCTGNHDGASHMLAGCPHPKFKASYISRHDRAVKLLQTALSKGSMGNCITYMDTGKREDLPTGVAGKLLPNWLRPPAIPRGNWRRYRPDIPLLPNCPATSPPPPGPLAIHLVEVGYCSDTNHEIKLLAK